MSDGITDARRMSRITPDEFIIMELRRLKALHFEMGSTIENIETEIKNKDEKNGSL